MCAAGYGDWLYQAQIADDSALELGDQVVLRPACLMEERFAGRRARADLGSGRPCTTVKLVNHDARIYIDVITADATIHFDDGRTVTLSRLAPDPDIAHPVLVRDEDITGDCCSSGCARVTIDTRNLDTGV